MPIAVGDPVPSATLHRMGDSGSESIQSEELFAGRKVVLFALPGAFTPTCSAKHLPGFIELAREFQEKGIDEIVCLSVNDAWVMNAWGQAQGAADKVSMIADGNGAFTRGMGRQADLSAAGFGERSGRYAMIVDDAVVTHLNIEKPRKFEVSDAATMLALL